MFTSELPGTDSSSVDLGYLREINPLVALVLGGGSTVEMAESGSVEFNLLDHDPVVAYHKILSGEIDPVESGLVFPQKSRAELFEGASGMLDRWKALAEDNTYIQDRVSGWSANGLEIADFIKFRSMHNLTEDGDLFEKYLRETLLSAIDAAEQTGIDLKNMSDWRLRGMVAVIARATSMDEMPQFLFHVLGLPGVKSDNLMNMSFQGSGRPMRPHEMVLSGDNSYDLTCRAVEKRAEHHGVDRHDYFNQLGVGFRPSIVSSATARGVTELNTEEDVTSWLVGVEQNRELMKKSPGAQKIAAIRQTYMTAAHLGIRAVTKISSSLLAA